MGKKSFDRFVHHWEDVTDIPPQSVGIFTPWYKEVTKRLKTMPWPFLLFGGIGIAFLLYILFGSSIVRLTSILQRGF